MASERTPNTRIGTRGQVTPGWSSLSRQSANFTNNPPQFELITAERTKPSFNKTLSFDSQSSTSDLSKGSFDICKKEIKSGCFKLNKSLLEISKERRKRELEIGHNKPKMVYLRSGMVLLKNFLGHNDQVKIIKLCRDLGIGTGGFYTPEYKDGAKLNLKMMCLGKNWDPNTSSYENTRSFDGAIPPKIPDVFVKLVLDAVRASHDFLKKKFKGEIDVEREIPFMTPDICIVNFYSNNGKLGLHQDKDETRDSLAKGLPVVSFSIGDSAEFLYGEERDLERVKRVELESGDVLLFGSESRHLFHGVSCVKLDSAPKSLLEESRLKNGRLNLTFRQY